MEAIEALSNNAAMWDYENPEAFQEDVNNLVCPYGPVDFLAKHATRVWEQSQPKRMFQQCANPGAYWQFSGVLSAWITQIQPINFKDYGDNRLKESNLVPELQLQLPQGSNTMGTQQDPSELRDIDKDPANVFAGIQTSDSRTWIDSKGTTTTVERRVQISQIASGPRNEDRRHKERGGTYNPSASSSRQPTSRRGRPSQQSRWQNSEDEEGNYLE